MSERPEPVATPRQPGSPGCPRIEPIAALLDRQLRGRDRQELLDHLAECEDCYGVFAATSQVLSTDLPDGLAAGRARILGRRFFIAALAAALAAALLLPLGLRFARRPASPPANELAQSLGATGRAVPIARPVADAADAAHAAASPGVAFGRAELRLAVAQMEGRRGEAAAAARALASLAGLSANGDTPRGLAVRGAYSRMADDLERGLAAPAAPLDGTATLFALAEVAGGRCLEAAEYAAGGGAWFATDSGRRCRAAVARLGLAGVDRVLAAWPESGAPDALALARALSAVGESAAGNRPR